MLGGSGGDYLQGGAPADLIDGGSDIDTASYVQSPGGVSVSLGTGAGFLSDAQGDTLIDIENLTGSFHDDQLQGNDDANKIKARDGNDLLKGFGGDDTLDGEKGADWLTVAWGPTTSTAATATTFCTIPSAAPSTRSTAAMTRTPQTLRVRLAVWVDLFVTETAYTYGPNAAKLADLASIENVVGTSNSDIVLGSDVDNVYGFTGNAAGTWDYFDGNGGNDTADFPFATRRCGSASTTPGSRRGAR